MRLFISINLPEELYGYCQSLQKQYKGMRLTSEFHITLQFLGDHITDELSGRIKASLGQITFKPFKVGLGDCMAYGPDGSPHGVWIECLPSPELEGLAAAVRATMRLSGFIDEKPFLAHITLGRFKQPPFYKPKVIKGEAREFLADRFFLMRSHLGADGPEYERVGYFLAK